MIVRYSIAKAPENLVSITLLDNMREDYEKRLQESKLKQQEALNEVHASNLYQNIQSQTNDELVEESKNQLAN